MTRGVKRNGYTSTHTGQVSRKTQAPTNHAQKSKKVIRKYFIDDGVWYADDIR